VSQDTFYRSALSGDYKSRHVSVIVLVALNAGMRKREIFDLTKDDVDFQKRIVHITHAKNWKIRDIPMNELLTKVLRGYRSKS